MSTAERTVTLAVLGTDAAARLDRRGGLRPVDRDWCIDWAVGAQDGWHLASTEAAVRQSLVDSSPVVVSSVRVPDGAVEQRCWAAVAGGRPVVVMELHSAAPVAVAVAVVVRPIIDGRVSSIDLDATVVRVDGRDALWFGRAPSRSTAGTADAVTTSILAGVVDSDRPVADLASPDGDLAAAFVFPLPHTATLRIVVPLGADEPRAPVDVASLPALDTVVSGWRVQTAGAPRVDLPEREVEAAVEAARRHLLGRVGDGTPVDGSGVPLGVGTVAELAMALDEQGLHAAARALLERVVDRQRSDGSFDGDHGDDPHVVDTAGLLVALDRHRRLADDDTLVAREIERIASAAHWLHRQHVGSPWRRGSRFFGRGSVDDTARAGAARWALAAFDSAARSLRSVGQPAAAALVDEYAVALVHDLHRRGVVADPPPDRPVAAIEQVRALVVEGAPLWTWPSPADGDDPLRAARFLRLVRAVLVDDSGEGIALLPGPVDAWFGSAVAAHDLPTVFGRLSFAVRWHGARPALLWDLAVRTGVDGSAGGSVRLAVPGLDPTWTSDEPCAEALLDEPAHEHEPRPTRPPPDGGDSFM